MLQAVDFRFSFAYSARMLPLTKRQREILDYLNDFIQQHGYAPSLEEIGRRFSLSSLATVHKHLTNLQEKGFIKCAWNRSRSVELVPSLVGGADVTLKKLYREQGRIRLQPANPAMQPIVVPSDQVQVQGVVVGVMRK